MLCDWAGCSYLGPWSSHSAGVDIFPRLPSTDQRAAIIFITKTTGSVWNRCRRYERFRKDNKPHCITASLISLYADHRIFWLEGTLEMTELIRLHCRSCKWGTAKRETWVRKAPLVAEAGWGSGSRLPVQRSLSLCCTSCLVWWPQMLSEQVALQEHLTIRSDVNVGTWYLQVQEVVLYSGWWPSVRSLLPRKKDEQRD